MTTEPKVTRKLRAILSADVKGYSRLMSEDETHTIKTIKEYRRIITTIVNDHSGRVVDAPGDNIMAEFSSVVNAVQCSVEIQKKLKERNADLPVDKRLEFRIGVNIGDVVQDGESLYGEGVNIAARIEGLADPGGVCISRGTYDHIRNKLKLGYEYIGEHSVKNIKNPVRVYKILMEPEDARKLIGEKPKSLVGKWLWSAIVVAAIIITSMVWLNFKENPAISEIPSIAVLPFDNLSDDPEQGYLSDGLTDELIGDLAKIKDIFVISRNSAFTYKGKAIKIKQVAKELNVRYVLEGSVQRAGNRLRIRAQLIDAKTDHHVWAESYDGDGTMDNIFELQDEVTRKIVTALAVKLTENEKEKISDKGTDNIAAYDAYLKALALYMKFTPESVLKSVDYYEQAIKIDPDFNRAYAGLAHSYWLLKTDSFGKPLKFESLERVIFVLKSRHYLDIAMKNPTWEAYRLSAYFDIYRRHYGNALNSIEKAYSIAPNEDLVNSTMGFCLIYSGKPKKALAYLNQAIKIGPQILDFTLYIIGLAHFTTGNYSEAISNCEKAISINSGMTEYYPILAASYALSGKEDKAVITFKNYSDKKFEGYASNNSYSSSESEYLYYAYPYKDHKNFENLLKGLKIAGLDEDPFQYHKIEKANKLNGDEIKGLFQGKKLIDKYGLSISHYKNGHLEIRPFGEDGPVIEDGKFWIKDNTVCIQADKLFGGYKICIDVYKASVNENKKYNYLYINDSFIFPFNMHELK